MDFSRSVGTFRSATPHFRGNRRERKGRRIGTGERQSLAEKRLGDNLRTFNPNRAAQRLEKAAAGSYFLDMPSRQTSRRHHASADLFEVPPAGFRYAPDLFPPAAEKALVAQFETLPFKPFEFHGYLGNRRVVSFGYRYDYAGRALRSAGEMPAFLAPLRVIASRFAGIPESELAQALVTEYAPGAGIGWHRDKPMFQDVVALSFLTPCVLRLRRGAGAGWERAAVEIAPRSGYLLHGPARTHWEHSIMPMDALRYSVTFRSFRPDYSRPGNAP